MPVIAVVNRKGGSGKSTLATHLAAHYANSGVAVMLGDVDWQQSTQTWLRSRGAQQLPKSAPIVGWAVDPKRVLRPPAGVHHVILDTPGGMRGFDLARVVAFADVILMPVCNSVFDRESAADCHAELMALPRVASGRCRIAAVGMRLDARTKAAEVLEAWAFGLQLPFVGVLREAQGYVRSVDRGLTVFDLPVAQGRADVAQWQPIVAWLELALRSVRRPAPGSQAAVQRPTLSAASRVEYVASGEGAPVRGSSPGPAAFPAPSSSRAPAASPSQPAVAKLPARRTPAVAKLPARRTPAVLLSSLLGWLTAPRFVQRNP